MQPSSFHSIFVPNGALSRASVRQISRLSSSPAGAGQVAYVMRYSGCSDTGNIRISVSFSPEKEKRGTTV